MCAFGTHLEARTPQCRLWLRLVALASSAGLQVSPLDAPRGLENLPGAPSATRIFRGAGPGASAPPGGHREWGFGKSQPRGNRSPYPKSPRHLSAPTQPQPELTPGAAATHLPSPALPSPPAMAPLLALLLVALVGLPLAVLPRGR
ncbi:PREDICTED: ly-6/neurotoxin-like protein 1 isoform X2 [Hipposideros armiger]|uniref:Ly-6/neurotoxin-like protein 1 isoform X2 n=1 Tax=Hipposideros armiger TaxID=186990 RepID=A0A8B7SLG0_HIPAR|nr:PREDICTED: ly-6/neurotoxin-like protein 1 isoform X2 [Hipposideros armiger]